MVDDDPGGRRASVHTLFPVPASVLPFTSGAGFVMRNPG